MVRGSWTNRKKTESMASKLKTDSYAEIEEKIHWAGNLPKRFLRNERWEGGTKQGET